MFSYTEWQWFSCTWKSLENKKRSELYLHICLTMSLWILIYDRPRTRLKQHFVSGITIRGKNVNRQLYQSTFHHDTFVIIHWLCLSSIPAEVTLSHWNRPRVISSCLAFPHWCRLFKINLWNSCWSGYCQGGPTKARVQSIHFTIKSTRSIISAGLKLLKGYPMPEGGNKATWRLVTNNHLTVYVETKSLEQHPNV